MIDAGHQDAIPHLILASASPRRAELLERHGYRFDVAVPRIDEPEPTPSGVTPAQHAEAMSFFKACSVAETLDAGLIVAADTVVTYRQEIFGKPADVDDARRILQTLRGTTHHVVTGVTLLDATTGRRDIRHALSVVSMARLTDEQLEAYLATGAWRGKAGAYGVQDRADAFIDHIDGSFTNVVGLPMELLEEMLTAWLAG